MPLLPNARARQLSGSGYEKELMPRKAADGHKRSFECAVAKYEKAVNADLVGPTGRYQ
jgi:hypothetical protein